ncbi:MAG: aspartate aminotransferase family protein, partial [Deltaproteobacteria bacterium]|nr:aspartate aminotransferase family protein [Deltaproteobacteria bacterium]
NGGPVRNFTDVCRSDIALFNQLFEALLSNGVSVAPSGYEALFVSLSHTDEALQRARAAFNNAFLRLKG